MHVGITGPADGGRVVGRSSGRAIFERGRDAERVGDGARIVDQVYIRRPSPDGPGRIGSLVVVAIYHDRGGIPGVRRERDGENVVPVGLIRRAGDLTEGDRTVDREPVIRQGGRGGNRQFRFHRLRSGNHLKDEASRERRSGQLPVPDGLFHGHAVDDRRARFIGIAAVIPRRDQGEVFNLVPVPIQANAPAHRADGAVDHAVNFRLNRHL